MSLPTSAPASAEAGDQSIGMLLVEAFAWGLLCALTSSVLGIVGYRAGARLYPQPYEQFPFDFFLIPMGLLVGFLAAGITRLAARDWGAAQMLALVALVSIGYGVALFQYSKARAVPAHVAFPSARVSEFSTD